MEELRGSLAEKNAQIYINRSKVKIESVSFSFISGY